jgi:hypothetical protein
MYDLTELRGFTDLAERIWVIRWAQKRWRLICRTVKESLVRQERKNSPGRVGFTAEKMSCLPTSGKAGIESAVPISKSSNAKLGWQNFNPRLDKIEKGSSDTLYGRVPEAKNAYDTVLANARRASLQNNWVRHEYPSRCCQRICEQWWRRLRSASTRAFANAFIPNESDVHQVDVSIVTFHCGTMPSFGICKDDWERYSTNENGTCFKGFVRGRRSERATTGAFEAIATRDTVDASKVDIADEPYNNELPNKSSKSPVRAFSSGTDRPMLLRQELNQFFRWTAAATAIEKKACQRHRKNRQRLRADVEA